MTAGNFVPWSIKNLRTGLSYVVDENQSQITYRVNHAMDASIVINNSDNSVTNAFNAEDEIQIIINGIVMYDGFIYILEDKLQPNRRKDLTISIMDWGSYLASKTIFERDYQLTKYSKDLLLDGASKITGLSAAGVDIVGLQGVDFAVKGRRFQGTYVKDIWYAAAETGGFDYFVDETKKLQAWPFEDVVDGSGNIRAIQIGGHNYQLVDFLPTQPYQLLVRNDKENIMWSQDVQNSYKSVTVENGLIQNYPGDINAGSTDSVHPKGYAYELSLWWLAQLDSLYDPGFRSTPVLQPFTFNSAENVGGGFSLPTIHINVASSSNVFAPNFLPRQYNATQTGLTNQKMGQIYNSWQTIGFFCNFTNLVGAGITNIFLRLLDQTTVGFPDFFRDILADYNLGKAQSGNTGWVYLEYYLPTTNNPANFGWSTELGSPSIIDSIIFDIRPQTGYVLGSHADFANFNLFGILGATVNGAGSPPTQQIIVNKNLTDPSQLLAYATRSQLRSNVTKKGPQVTIDGLDKSGVFHLTDFKKPGYKIDIDVSASLGTGRSANSLRIDEIKLYLDSGFTYATITFDSSFYRP